MDIPKYVTLDPDTDSICAKIDYLSSSGLSNYDQLAREVLGVASWPRLPDNAIVEKGFAAGDSDLRRKVGREDYYTANCLCFQRVIESLATTEAKALLTDHAKDQLLIKNYAKLFSDLLFDSIELLTQYATIILKHGVLHPIVKSRNVHTLPLWHFTRQLAYGQVSGHAFADREPEVAVAGIRLVIEVRLRRAIGIIRKKRVSDPLHQAPVKLSTIIAAVKKHADAIQLPVPIQNIDRIYKWANEFVHGGTREGMWSWLSLFALEYLKPFAIGVTGGESWDSRSGFQYSSSTLEAIRQSVLSSENRVDQQRSFLRHLLALVLRRRTRPMWELELATDVEAVLTDRMSPHTV